MADETAALDAIYGAANTLLDAEKKLAKEGVDTFPDVSSHHHFAVLTVLQ
jgi:hypothetical protein